MPAPHADLTERAPRRPCPNGALRPSFRHVMACLDRSSSAKQVLAQAVMIADLSGAELTALRVLPAPRDGRPADPVDWDLSCRDENGALQELASAVGAPDHLKTAVVAGNPAFSICNAARDRVVDLAVLAAAVPGNPGGWGLGSTARHVAEHFDHSVLIVPGGPMSAAPDSLPPRRILVPLDGSTRAEAALRIASRIAAASDAEIVLLHAVPDVRPSVIAPLAPEDEALCDRLKRHAERSAQAQLTRIRSFIPADAIRSRMRLLTGEDPRRALARAISEEGGDLVVLSARGHGQDPHLRIGSTADYLLSRIVMPVLVVRDTDPGAHHHQGQAPARYPAARGSG